jgi:hypothetical protein
VADESARHGGPFGTGPFTRFRAGSRAEILRWAIGRIRENPAYARIQDRVHEISELKAQF